MSLDLKVLYNLEEEISYFPGYSMAVAASSSQGEFRGKLGAEKCDRGQVGKDGACRGR